MNASSFNPDHLGVPAPMEAFVEFQATRCRKAEMRIVASVMPMVKALAKKYEAWAALNSDLTIDDLEQVGMMGVMRSAQLFDPNNGTKFSSYVFKTISQRMIRAVNPRKKRLLIHSYDAPVESCPGISYRGMIESPELDDSPNFSWDELISLLDDPRQKQVIENRFVREKTLEEVGLEIGKTKEWVRQIQNKALKIMRARLNFVMETA